MNNISTNIVVKFSIEGFHHWKDAPQEVAFLRDNHRHLFFFRLEKKVSHQDRDIEIILFGRQVKQYLFDKYGVQCFTKATYLQFGSMSCEMISEELLRKFNLELAETTEDDENGAIVYKTTTEVTHIGNHIGNLHL